MDERVIGAFMGGQGAKSRSIAWCDDGTTPTLKSSFSGGNAVPDVVYETAVFNESGKCYSLNAMHGHDVYVVCFRKSTKSQTGGKGDKWVQDEIVNTLNGYEFHSAVRTPEIVCYAPNGYNANGNMCTLNTTEKHAICYAIDSHPADSRFELEGEKTPTITRKIAKGSCDGHLVLIACDARGNMTGGGRNSTDNDRRP